MAFSSIFKKATYLLGFGGNNNLKPPPLDGEIIYCKNNVCVHPPASLTADKEEHHQGYLTIRSHTDKISGPTLILTWIPNSTLKKNTRSIENSPNKSTPSPRRTPRQEFAKCEDFVTTPSTDITNLSPLESYMSLPSDGGDIGLRNIGKKRSTCSLDSINSDFSMGSKDAEDVFSPDDNSGTVHKSSSESNGRSQADSGIINGAVECVQNNVKCKDNLNKDLKVGVNVNDLYSENLNKISADIDNLTKAALEDSSMSESDSVSTEDKLSALLNKHKLQAKPIERLDSNKSGRTNSSRSARTDSSRSVSIELEGDHIRIVTEELDDEVMVETKDVNINDKNSSVADKNATKDSKRSTITDKDLAVVDTDVNKDESSSVSPDNDLSSISISSESTNPSPSGKHYNRMINEIRGRLDKDLNGQSEQINAPGDQSTAKNCTNSEMSTNTNHMVNSRTNSETTTDSLKTDGTSSSSAKNHPTTLDLNSAIISNHVNYSTSDPINTPDIAVSRLSSSSGSTSGPDSTPPSPYSESPPSPLYSPRFNQDSPSSSDSLSHNLQFPENALSKPKIDKDKKTAKEQVCGVFSVDLGQMRSLRVFYSNPDNTQGQIVIASRESQYKILHFHHGGLDKLAEIFQDWSLFAHAHEKTVTEGEKNYKQFMIVKPQLTDDQCHPEEGVYSMVTEDIWRTHMMDDGVVEDDYQLRKAIFFGGLDPGLRHETWPFLLHYFSFDSTFDEREQHRNDKYIEYQNIRKMRDSMSDEEKEQFWRNVQCTVEKDVIRTDRSHPYFRGEHNPNLEVLKNILLNYAVANPKYGYTQGMSDLLAPVLAEVQNEVDAYWCFVGLMQKTIFFSSPKDTDMDNQLNYLRELLRIMQPSFYEHLNHLGEDAMELLFCHRWILLCFKREFNEKEALRIWEACWSHYQTDYFHLFICVAIVSIYGEDVIEQCLPADEILLHFSSLACHMSGELVLRKARGLLHQYRKRPVIPCTLHGLCSLCGEGMWDSGHVPTVECVGNHSNENCPYLSHPNSPVREDF